MRGSKSLAFLRCCMASFLLSWQGGRVRAKRRSAVHNVSEEAARSGTAGPRRINPSISMNLPFLLREAILRAGNRGKADMTPGLQERVEYGRAIRQRAMCLIETHGTEAAEEALRAAREPGLAA